MIKKILSWLMVVCLLLSYIPTAAFAAEKKGTKDSPYKLEEGTNSFTNLEKAAYIYFEFTAPSGGELKINIATSTGKWNHIVGTSSRWDSQPDAQSMKKGDAFLLGVRIYTDGSDKWGGCAGDITVTVDFTPDGGPAECQHPNKAPGEAKAATCTEPGNTAGEYCPDCDTWVVTQEVIEPGHTWGEWIDGVRACVVVGCGQKEYCYHTSYVEGICTVCGMAEPVLPEYVVLPEGVTVESFGDKTVTDGTNYYATLADALRGVHGTDNAVLYCKPGADVGSMTHGHVCKTLTVYGNGAYISGGEQDFEVEYYVCGSASQMGSGLTDDMTLTVNYLNGAGAWGNRTSAYNIDLVFVGCQDMGKIWMMGTTGTLDITLTDCSFDGVKYGSGNCTVYSNSNGVITLTNVAFSGMQKAINLNHKVAGTQTVILTGCTFTNCGNDVAADQIPVRVLSSVAGGESVLTVSGCTFTGTPEGGADILLPAGNGTTVATISGTAANVSNEGTMVAVKADETYTNVAPAPDVAAVNGVVYKTLQEAIAAAQNGETIVLMANVAEDVTVSEGKTVILDLAGFDIVGTINAITNNGTLTINDSVGTGNVYTTDVSAQGRATIVNNGTLIINGGWFGDSNNDTTDRNAINRGNALKNFGEATINGGYFTNVSNQYIGTDAYAYAINTMDGGKTIINNVVVYGDINGLIYSAGETVVNDGSFTLGRPDEENNLWYLAYGNVEIKGGTWTRAFKVPSWNTGYYIFTDAVKVSGGVFNVEIDEANLADGYAALPDLNGNYVVGSKPTATVNHLGMTTVPAGEYGVWDGSNYDGTVAVEMPLSFVMQFLADQDEEDMATSPFADWYGDFVITFTGIKNGSFIADGCYLAGFYGDFGWVKVPVDGMEIEEGVRYPVMLGVGLGQKYDYICSGVQDFKCALYLTPEILAANPNIKVKLELAVVDNSQGSDDAASALINNEKVYTVTEYTYDAEDFVVKNYVAQIGKQKFESLQDAVAVGGEITLLADITVSETITIPAGVTVTLDLNGKKVVYNSTVMGEAMITNKGTLTINDTVGDGEIFYNYTGANDASYGKGNYTISNAGTLTVNGGKIHIANLRAHAKYPIDNNSTTGDAMLVINGGHLYNYNTSAIRQFCNSTVYKNSVTINGGLIEGYSAIWVQNPGKQTVNGTLTINGGEIRTTAAAYVNGTAELKDVSSRIYFTIDGVGGAWSEGSALIITGGIFNENVYLAENAPANITIGENVTFNGRLELPAAPAPEVGVTDKGGTTVAVEIIDKGDNSYDVEPKDEDFTMPEGGVVMTFPAVEDADEGDMAFVVHQHETAEGKVSNYIYVGKVQGGAITITNTVGFSTFTVNAGGLAEALTAAKTMTGNVTIEIYDKVTLSTALSGSFDSIKFVGKDTDAEIYLDVQGYITATGKKVAFENLKLSKSVGGYVANAGFMNVAFGIYDVTEVTYTNCTFANGAYASSGKNTFTDCTFYRSHDKYSLWAYGDVDITVDGCTFADYRGIKMYAEGSAKTVDLTVKNTNFSAVDNKPAIVLTYGESVTLEGNTYSSTGVFELDLDGAPNGTAVTSDVAPTCKNDNGVCGVLVDGKIYTTVAQAAEVATSGSTVVLLHNSAETVELPEGVTLEKNGFDAAGVTVKVPAKNIEVTDAEGNVTYYTGFTGFSDLNLANCVITLIGDVSDANLILNKGDTNVVLDLNGYTFSRTGSGSGAINLTQGAGLTIKDSSEAKTGKILCDTYAVWMMNGDFVLESGIIETTSTKNAAVYANSAEVEIKDGKIVSAGNAITVGENFIESRGTSTIVISGGEIQAEGYGLVNGSYSQAATSIEVTGGKINSVNDSISVTTGTVAVSGGTFSSDVSEYCVDGFETVENEDGTFGVQVAKTYVAQIGEQKFETLAEALLAAQNGDTIVLLADVTLDSAVTLTDIALTITGDYTLNANNLLTLAGTVTLNALKLTGDVAAAGNAVIKDTNIGGYLYLNASDSTLTFQGDNKVNGFSASYYNNVITIGEGAYLEITGSQRLTIGWGNTFNITGTVEDAKTADKSAIKPSLKVAAGITVNGSSALTTFNVTNAHIVLSSTCGTNKNATGKFVISFTNSIADLSMFKQQYAYGTYDVDFIDSVINVGANLVFLSPDAVVDVNNSNITVNSSFGNAGKFTLSNGSVMTVKSMLESTENGYNSGLTIVDNATLNVTGGVYSGYNTGKLQVVNGGVANINKIVKSTIELDADSTVNVTTIDATSSIILGAGASMVAPEGLTVTTAEGWEVKYENGAFISVQPKVYVAEVNGEKFETVAAALAYAKDQGMTDVVIILIGETTSATTDSFDLYNTTLFNSVTFKQEDPTKIYYLYDLYTGARTNDGKFVFDGVNIVVTDQYIFEGKVELINNSIIKSVADANCFVYYAEVTIEPGSKLYGVIEDFRGGDMIIDGGKTDGSYNTVPDFQDSIITIRWGGDKLVLQNGAYAKINAANEVGRLTINAGAAVEMFASKLEAVEYITVSGTLQLDLKSLVSTKKITGAGKIIVDVSGFNGEAIQLITADMTGFTGTVELINSNNYVDYELSSTGLTIEKKTLAGSGTEEDPYLISTLEDMILFRDSVNAGETIYSAPGVYVALSANIDLAGENWVGIGSMAAEHGFMGNFDGKGFKIKNLTITDPALDSDGYAYAGLFALTEGVDKDHQNFIKNLIIENVTISTTGHIVAAAIAYPYYTIVENVTVCGDIAITGGNYTAGVLAYTRRCVNASNVTVSGNAGSYITGAQVVGGVISDIQMNGGLIANYSNFKAEGLTITGTKNVGGICGIIATQTLNGATVKNVELVCGNANVGTVAGCLGGTSTISNVTVENVTGATVIVGGTYDGGKAVQAKIGDTYYATFADAYAAAQAGETVTLLADLNLSEILVIDKGITLDGNGHKLTSTAGRAINVSGANGVTIKNLTIDAKGERAINVIVNATNVTIDNVTATAANYTVNVAASAPNAVVTINGSTLNGLCTVNVAAAGAEVTIDNSTINCNDNNTTAGESYAALCLNKAAVGGSIIATNTTVNVTAGSDSEKGRNGAENGTVIINGSTEDVTITVAVITYANTDNYHGFQSLQEAIEFAKAGDTITLIRDIELTEGVTVPAGKNITLDLNGKTISGTDTTNKSFSLITNKGVLTITDSVGNGKITLVATQDTGYSRYSSVISNTVGGKLIVESGTIEHLGGHTMAYAIDNLTNGKGTYAETVINGGTIKSSYVGIRQFLNGVEADNILTVNGGTVTGNNTSIFFQDPSASCNSGKLTVGNGATLGNRIYISGTAGTAWQVELAISAQALGNYGIVTDEIPVTSVIKEVNGVYGFVEAVASVNGVGYATLQEAINVGGEIKLLADIELTEGVVIAAGQEVVLDLNGKTVSMVTAEAAQYALVLNKGNLTITDSGENGKLSYQYTGTDQSDAHNTIESTPNSVLTIKGGLIENLSENCLIAYAIDGLTNGNGGDVTVNIEGGKISSKKIAVRIFANSTTNTGTLNISGGEIFGRTIIQSSNTNANKAALNITGGIFTTNGYKSDVLYVGGTGNAAAVNASVSGGTFSGEILSSMSTGFISGGSFKAPVAEELCAEGFQPKDNGDGTYGVEEKPEITYSFNSSMQAFLTLESIVQLNVGFKLDNLNGVDPATLLNNVGLLVWNADSLPANPGIENCNNVLTNVTYNATKSRFEVRTAGIAAKEMGDAIAFMPYYTDGNGNYIYGRLIASYSPKAYCYGQLKDTDTSDDALMIAILNYGAAAQNYFGYKTDSLMNADLPADQKIPAWSDSLVRSDWSVPAAKEGNLDRDSQITSRGGYLSLVGTIDVNYYFKVDASINVAKAELLLWSEEEYNACDTLSVENAGKTVTMQYMSDKGRYEYRYEGIAAKEMFSAIYACAMITDANGNVYYSGVVAYSAERYAYIASNGNNPLETALAQCIAVYGDAAKNYFN